MFDSWVVAFGAHLQPIAHPQIGPGKIKALMDSSYED